MARISGPYSGPMYVEGEVSEPVQFLDRQLARGPAAGGLLDVQPRERVDLDQPDVERVPEHVAGDDGRLGGTPRAKVSAP